MTNVTLSDYFVGVGAKRLSTVETRPTISNQHEFNGVAALRALLGVAAGGRKFAARLIYLDDETQPVIEDAELSWYDSRENQPHRAAEWRLYYPATTLVAEQADQGDLLLVGLRQGGELLVVVARDGSTVAAQMLSLFGLVEPGPNGSYRVGLDSDFDQLSLVSRLVLENIGVEIEVTEPSLLDDMLTRFGDRLPETRLFSAYAREVSGLSDAKFDPDATLMVWMEQEEVLFRTMERYLVSARLEEGFGDDVDEFVKYSLSVHNRRKSRVGHALEHHLEAVFRDIGLRFSRSKATENKAKPDFIFPSIEAYHSEDFDASLLTMLGAKSTCKDRWRQVLSEAQKIHDKHLLTLEPAISVNQTDEMQASRLQLVVPQDLHATYTADQQTWLLTLGEFCSMAHDRQTRAGIIAMR